MALNLTVPAAYRSCLRVGTCSWKYEGWKGLIYEPGVRYGGEDYLRDYARHFNSVEVDQWFWSLFPTAVKLPDPATAKAYAASVPEDFLFTVKAPNALTLTHHYARQTKAHADVANKPNPSFLSVDLLHRFLETLAPMGAKLGPVMFQFEYLNKTKMASLAAFLDALHRFFEKAPKGFTYAIETRNPNYLSDAFFGFLRQEGLGFVFLEGYYMPPIGEVVRKHATHTPAATVVRLHGPDRQAIEEATDSVWDHIVAEKPEAIAAAVGIVREARRLGHKVFVNINNHFEGCAPLTALRLLRALEERQAEG